ncbi:MAG TPA: T9SS type A sorting domain-containing protein [Flavobacteriales bacterium]|nr:T9SS type A sorting domain-containing protein [Flavobacteriales bacterium]
MKPRNYSFLIAVFLLNAFPIQAQLTILTQFNPSNTGGLCGIAYNSPVGEVLVIGCSANTIDRYTEDGTFLTSAAMVGGTANDVDIDMSPTDLMLNGTFVDQGQLLLVNGESGVAEIFAIDEVTNEVIDTLITDYGVSHVVGGSYHPLRGTFYLVQDNVPSGFNGNRVAEIDTATGDTLQTFPLDPNFDVNFGDMDISPISGNLFIVSSSDAGIAEFTPDGVFVQNHALPVGISGLSGIALDNDLEGAWVCNTSGVVWKLGNFPLGINEEGLSNDISAIYPNPATDQVTVTFSSATSEKDRIQLRDVLGRSVKMLGTGNRSVGSTNITYDISSVPSGSYFISVDGASGTVARHLVVVRP